MLQDLLLVLAGYTTQDELRFMSSEEDTAADLADLAAFDSINVSVHHFVQPTPNYERSREAALAASSDGASRSGYHLIQSVPDHVNETAITVGALVDVKDTWRFEPAPAGERLLPPALPAAASLLFRSLMAELQGLTRPRLPIALGPHLRIGARREVPTGVEDAITWVVSAVLAPR